MGSNVENLIALCPPVPNRYKTIWRKKLLMLEKKFEICKKKNLNNYIVNELIVATTANDDKKVVTICAMGKDSSENMKNVQLTLMQVQFLNYLQYIHYLMCFREGIDYESGLILVKVTHLPVQRLYLDIDLNNSIICNDENLAEIKHEQSKIIFDFLQLIYEIFPNITDKICLITSKQNSLNFHMYINVHVDFITKHYIMLKFTEYFRTHVFFYTLDNPTNMSFSCVRNHWPRYKIQISQAIESSAAEFNLIDWAIDNGPIIISDWLIMAPIDLNNLNIYGLETLSGSTNEQHITFDFYTAEHENLPSVVQKTDMLIYDYNLFDNNLDFLETASSVSSPMHLLNKKMYLSNSSPLMKKKIYQSCNGYVQCSSSNLNLPIKYNIDVIYEFIKKFSQYEVRKNIVCDDDDDDDDENNFIPQELYEYVRLFNLNDRLLTDGSENIFYQKKKINQNISLKKMILEEDHINPKLTQTSIVVHFSDFTMFPFTKQQLNILDIINEMQYNQQNVEILLVHLFKELFITHKKVDYSWALYILCVELDIIPTSRLIFPIEDINSKSGGSGDINIYTGPSVKRSKKSDIIIGSNTMSLKDAFQDFTNEDKCNVVRRLLECVINVGSVTSVLKFCYESTIFRHLIHYICFLCKYCNISLHAKYILTYYATLPDVPSSYFTESLYNNDIFSTLFFIYCDKQTSDGKKQFVHLYRDFPETWAIFVQLMQTYKHIVINRLDIFFTYICGLQSLKNNEFVMFHQGYNSIIEQQRLRIHFDYPYGLEDDYIEKYTEFSFFVNHIDIGLFNSPLNVYEFPGAMFKTLVAFKKVATLESNLLSNTYYPKFQQQLFDTYQKTFFFLKKCHEDSLNVMLLAPLFPPNIYQDYQINFDKEYSLIDFKIINFITTFSDFIKQPIIQNEHNLKKNKQLWNNDFLQKMYDDNDNENMFKQLLKYIYIIFCNVIETYNLNFDKFNDIIYLLFGKDILFYLGLPINSTKITKNEMSIVSTMTTTTTTTTALPPQSPSQAVVADTDDQHLSNTDKYFNIDYADIFSSTDKNTFFYEYLCEQIRKVDKSDEQSSTAKSNQQFVMSIIDEVFAENTPVMVSLPSAISPDRINNVKIQVNTTTNTTYLNKNLFLNILNNFNDELLNTFAECVNFSQQKLNTSIKQFFIVFASWIIRMGNEHMYRDTALFKFINKNRRRIYADLEVMICKTSGPLFKCENLDELANLIEAFTKQTKSDCSFNFQQQQNRPLTFYYEHENIAQILAKYDSLNSYERNEEITEYLRNVDEQMCNEHSYTIARILALLLLFTELNFDTFEDLIKFLVSLQFRGNMHRTCTYLYGVTSSLKTQMANLFANIHQSSEHSTIPNVNISRMPGQDFDAVAKTANVNSLIIFDEVGAINPTRIKQIANLGSISTRPIHSGALVSFAINAKTLITSNKEVGADYATMVRFKLFEKTSQFCSIEETNSMINRLLLDDSQNTNNGTSAILGASILLKRYINWKPASIELSGLKLLQQFLLPLFFFQCYTPISNLNSETMLETHRKYLIKNYPVFNFISRIKIVPSESIMSQQFFIEILSRWWKTNNSQFSILDYNLQCFVTDVCNYLEYFKQPCNGYKFNIENIEI